jgi:small subunit ribosomal protein S27Ae
VAGNKKPRSKSKHRNVQRWKKYEMGDKLVRNGKFCPRCGEGYYLAEHKNRLTCGRCGYSEIKTQ